MHRALADATDPEVDPDRRAWHLAQATPGFDEDVASELERSAGRAQARGGLSAAAAFLERATTLTLDPARRAERALAAAQAKYHAGALDVALGLVAIADSGPLDRVPARPSGCAARTDRVRREPRPRRPAAAAEGREAARVARREASARNLPRRVDRGGVGPPPGHGRRSLAGRRCRRVLPRRCGRRAHPISSSMAGCC